MVFPAPKYGVQIYLLVIGIVLCISTYSEANLYDGKLKFNLGVVISNENNGPIRIRRFDNDQGQSARRAKIYEKPILRMKDDDDDDADLEAEPIKRSKNLEPHIEDAVQKPKKKKKEKEAATPSDADSDDGGGKVGGSTRGMRPEEFEPESGGDSGHVAAPIARGYSSDDDGKKDDDDDDFKK